MSLIKTSVPNELVLNKKIKEALEAGITDFIARTKERRITVIMNRRYAVTSVAVFIFSIFALTLAHNYLEGAVLNVVTMYLLGLVVATFILNHRWYREEKVLAQELNLALVPIITSTFSRLALYTHDKSHRVAAKEVLLESGILPEAESLVSADDVFMFFEPYPVQVRKIIYRRPLSKLRFWQNKPVSGVLVEADLQNSLSGQTFVSTYETSLLADKKPFWSDFVNVLSPVKLNKDISGFGEAVATNTLEAESILTTELLTVLERWFDDSQIAIRIVLKGGKFYLFFPDNTTSFADSATATDSKSLELLANSVLKPIWRALALVEEVK